MHSGWCLAPKFLASIFGNKRETLGLGHSRAFLKVWTIHAKKRQYLQTMSNVPLYRWLKASQSVRLVKRVRHFLILNKKTPKPNPTQKNPSDVLCAPYRLAPRSSCLIHSAWWLRCIMGSNVPSRCAEEQVATCQLRNCMCIWVTYTHM